MWRITFANASTCAASATFAAYCWTMASTSTPGGAFASRARTRAVSWLTAGGGPPRPPPAGVAPPPPPPRRDEDELVDALRALVGEERRQPAAHRVADDVRPLDAEGIHELAHVVDEIGEGELDVEDVAGAPVEAVEGEDAQSGRQRRQVGQPHVGAVVEAGAVEEEGRGSYARPRVARPGGAQRYVPLRDPRRLRRQRTPLLPPPFVVSLSNHDRSSAHSSFDKLRACPERSEGTNGVSLAVKISASTRQIKATGGWPRGSCAWRCQWRRRPPPAADGGVHVAVPGLGRSPKRSCALS